MFCGGGAIILVIAIHSFTGFEVTEKNTLTYHLAIIWRQIIGFAVPLFLAISGYFLSKKEVSTKSQYLLFLKKQVPRVYIPMLIWSIPYLMLSVYTGKNTGTSLILFLVGGFSVYYFIALIVQYYILLPVLQKLGSKIKGLILSALLSALCMIILLYMTTMQNISIPLILYAGPFPVWIVFFVLGIYMGKRDKLSVSTKLLFIFALAGLLISIAETYLHIYISGSFQGLGIKLGAFIYSFTVILFLFSMQTNKSLNSLVWRFMVYLGRISFGVYLTHIFFLSYLARPVVNRIAINNYFVDQLLLISLTMMCCVGFITVVRKINKPLAVKYLGF
jgi:surface polysaccharide O-acyltransferase-like enzyme